MKTLNTPLRNHFQSIWIVVFAMMGQVKTGNHEKIFVHLLISSFPVYKQKILAKYNI